MSREIKFRIWMGDPNDYRTGEMFSAKTAFEENFIEFNDSGKLEPTDECSTIMQFTGLLDKNGVEIYESDILKIHNSGLAKESEPLAVKYSGSGFVIYSPDCCDACKSGGACISNLDEWPQDSYEVIGNLFEHPHLLTPTGGNEDKIGKVCTT